jgi:hypothetical protein
MYLSLGFIVVSLLGIGLALKNNGLLMASLTMALLGVFKFLQYKYHSTSSGEKRLSPFNVTAAG